MKDYFFTAKRVSDLIRIYCTLIEDKEKLIPGLKIKKSKEIKINNFVIKNKRIDFSKNFKFKNIILNNYNSFFKILEIAQQKNLDIHPKAVKFILDNIKRVKNKISGKKEFLLSFLKILTSKKNSTGDLASTTLQRGSSEPTAADAAALAVQFPRGLTPEHPHKVQ